MRKRTANQAFDRAPIDTNFGRFNQDLDTQQGRLGVEFQRDWDDRNLVKLPRAQREATEFGLDLGAQRWFQSKQAGYLAPVKPANERTVAGLTVRVGGAKKPVGQRTYTTSTGQQLSRSGFVNTIRRRPAVPACRGRDGASLRAGDSWAARAVARVAARPEVEPAGGGGRRGGDQGVRHGGVA
jgi:hypothetical protein